MKEVYAILDKHTRYVATKEFFKAKMTEGSSVQEHGVKMLSLVEKARGPKVGPDNDMYIDVMIKKYEPSVLIGEASTSKAKGKRIGRWKKKKGKAKGKTIVVAKDAKSAPVAPGGQGKEGRVFQQQSRANDGCTHCLERHWKRIVPIYLPIKTSVDHWILRWRGFSYFITFIDDHSRHGYVYLMRYKSEAFVRFKEFKLEAENQTDRKIKTLRSNPGGEYLSGEFIDYLSAHFSGRLS
ncbi:UNVERIFIED_CONTAM: hypothetical protein Sradi_4908200 [Sesamum radiatum]|uniref:Integrase catalytic domain-containing protein n=1 Tax=Sesamum radiatum TaxID=300843 RepID=A0AAW2MF22_SESRA